MVIFILEVSFEKVVKFSQVPRARRLTGTWPNKKGRVDLEKMNFQSQLCLELQKAEARDFDLDDLSN